MSIDATVAVSFVANDRRTVGISTNSAANLPCNQAPSISFTNGVGANQADILCQGTRTLSGGADNLDFNGVLTDSYGSTVNSLRIKALYLKNKSATNTMTFGNHATAAWATFLSSTGTMTLRPGAFFLIAAPDATGWAVTAATGDIIKVAGTGTDTYDFAFLAGDA